MAAMSDNVRSPRTMSKLAKWKVFSAIFCPEHVGNIVSDGYPLHVDQFVHLILEIILKLDYEIYHNRSARRLRN